MKKFSIVLLALLLCASMLFTGCVTPEIPEEDDGNKKNPSTQTQEVNKDTVIKNFNKIDLYAMYKTIEKGAEELGNLDAVRNYDIYALEQQFNGKLIMGENSADISVALKDGIAHYQLVDTTPGATGREEAYVYITEAFDTITFELGKDGKWAPEQYGENVPVYPEYGDDFGGDIYPSTGYAMTRDTAAGVGVGSLSELLGFDAEILKRITIPKIAENQLTEKDGKLVLDNSYFADLVVANYDLLLELLGAEGAPTKDELRAEIEESLAPIGLEIAFTANDRAITGVYIVVAPEEEETTIVLEVELSDNGKVLERIKAEVKVGTEYGYDTGVSVELTTTLDGNNITAAKLVAEINVASDDHMVFEYINDGYIQKHVKVCSTYRFEANITGIDRGEEFKFAATLTSNVDKVFEVSERYSYETYEPTVTFEEIGIDDYNMDASAELSVIYNNKAQKCDISFSFEREDMDMALNGTWFLTIAPNAGKVPAEITEYINNLY